jgi:hypothetical protein
MLVKPLLIAIALLHGWPDMAGANEPCLALPPEAALVRLAGVDAAGDPVLVDGRRLRLLGVAPRQDAGAAARFAAEIDLWRERDLGLVAIGGTDRWGRQPGRLLIPPAAPGELVRDLALALVEASAVARMPEAAHAGCGMPPRADTAGQTRARRRPALNRPVTPPPPGVLDGHDVAVLKAQAGRLVAVEGRIASVGERAQRTYLNFSRRRGEAGAVMLSRRLWREMQATGWTASGLNGKRLRASGVLSGQDGLLLEATSANALELID